MKYIYIKSKKKKKVNLKNEIALADVSWFHTCPIFKLISSKQNINGTKSYWKSSNPFTFSTH